MDREKKRRQDAALLGIRRNEQRPCGQYVGRHHDNRAPDQVPGNCLHVDDLHAHVQRNLDSQQGEDHEAIEAPRGRRAAEVQRVGVHALKPAAGIDVEVTEVGEGVVSLSEPEDTRQTDREYRQTVEDEDQVDNVLCQAKPQR